MVRAQTHVPSSSSDGARLLVDPRYVLKSNARQFLDHQFILATSVDVERTFNQGRLLLSHIRNRLSVQSTRALLCLGICSEMGYVRDKDVKAVTMLPEVGEDDEDDDLGDNWDAI